MREKFNSIDLFKFLMAIVVVAFHTNPFVDCESILVNEIVNIIADVSVPFFFTASGFFLALGWGDSCQQRENYVRKMLVSIFRLYTIWTLISLPLTLYGYVISGNSFASCIFSYVKYFIFVGKLYNSYHLWYLLAMLYALLAMLILIRREKGTRCILIMGIFFYTVYMFFAWIQRSADVNELLALAGKMFYFVFNNGGVFTGMLYMSIGIYIREHRKLGSLTSGVGILAGIIVRYTFSQELGNILSAVMLFILVLNMELPDHSCYLFLRGLSKYIYLLHLLCFSFYTFIIIGQPNKLGVDSFIVTFTLAAVISAVIVHLKDLSKRENEK